MVWAARGRVGLVSGELGGACCPAACSAACVRWPGARRARRGGFAPAATFFQSS